MYSPLDTTELKGSAAAQGGHARPGTGTEMALRQLPGAEGGQEGPAGGLGRRRGGTQEKPKLPLLLATVAKSNTHGL